MRCVRAGERAALVTEQLALEQRLGQRRAVEAQERLRRARRAPVHGLGEHLLADAGLAEDQHADRRRRRRARRARAAGASRRERTTIGRDRRVDPRARRALAQPALRHRARRRVRPSRGNTATPTRASSPTSSNAARARDTIALRVGFGALDAAAPRSRPGRTSRRTSSARSVFASTCCTEVAASPAGAAGARAPNVAAGARCARALVLEPALEVAVRPDAPLARRRRARCCTITMAEPSSIDFAERQRRWACPPPAAHRARACRWRCPCPRWSRSSATRRARVHARHRRVDDLDFVLARAADADHAGLGQDGCVDTTPLTMTSRPALACGTLTAGVLRRVDALSLMARGQSDTMAASVSTSCAGVIPNRERPALYWGCTRRGVARPPSRRNQGGACRRSRALRDSSAPASSSAHGTLTSSGAASLPASVAASVPPSREAGSWHGKAPASSPLRQPARLCRPHQCRTRCPPPRRCRSCHRRSHPGVRDAARPRIRHRPPPVPPRRQAQARAAGLHRPAAPCPPRRRIPRSFAAAAMLAAGSEVVGCAWCAMLCRNRGAAAAQGATHP